MSQYNDVLVQQIVSATNGSKASREENDRLYPLVAAGDQKAAKRMIELNMSLAIDKVDTFIGCYPSAAHLRDDLVSEGFLGLTIAVRKMAEEGPKEKPNATGYLSYWIHASIGALLDNEESNGNSAWVKNQRELDGINEFIPTQVPMPENFNPTHKSQDTVDPMAVPDLWDSIYAACETEEDKVIVNMRAAGHTDSEIAQTLGISHTSAYMLRRDIYARFLQKSDLSGEV